MLANNISCRGAYRVDRFTCKGNPAVSGVRSEQCDITSSGIHHLHWSSYCYGSQVLCANSFLAVAVLAPAIAMHVRMDFKSLPEPNWSVEKTNAFYYSKLILVLHDFKCSGLAGLSPESNEKKSIKTLMDYITSSHLHVKKEYEACDSSVCKPVGATTRKRGIDVLIDDGGKDHFYPLGPLMFTAGFFYGKLVEYMKQQRKSCLNLMLGIMGKLELDGYPASLFAVDDNNIMLEWLKQVKFNRPRNSANDVHRSVLLARYAASLIQGISSSVEDACAELTDMLRRRQHCYEFAPQALLVLLLLDCSAFGKAGEKMVTLQDREALNSDCSTSRQCSVTYLNCHSGVESSDNGLKCGDSNTDNVKILTTICQVLKGIGTSDALGAPSPSEVIILDQIMEHISLCIDGFLCTKAYQKERDLRRIPYRIVGSELSRIRANGVPRYLYDGCVYGAEVMSERLKQLQEGFNLVIQALQKLEIS